MRQRPSWNSLSVSVEVINILEDCSNILIRIHTFPAIFPSLTIPSLDETPLRLCSLLLELLLRPEQSLSCILTNAITPQCYQCYHSRVLTPTAEVQLFAPRAAALLPEQMVTVTVVLVNNNHWQHSDRAEHPLLTHGQCQTGYYDVGKTPVTTQHNTERDMVWT